LNRHKKWEKIAEILKDVDCDEKCTITRGKGNDAKWGDREVEITKIGYFDLDEMKIQTDRLQRDQQRYDRDLNDDVQYIEDKHFATIQRKERHNKLRRWKEAQCVKPRVITQHSSFVPVKAITASSVRSGCKVRMATVRSFGKRSYWSPRRQHDDRDFIQIDLGKDFFVEAISTRGRVLRRNRDYEPLLTPSETEFVKKYRVKIKGDSSSKHNATDPEADDEWIGLGVFDGNTDCETEKVTKLTLPFQKGQGVVCRYIRINPLSAAEGGFHGAKAMRVGVYGHPPFGREHREEVTEKEVITDKGSGEMIKDKSVPAAIITIKQPAVNHKRSCFAVPGQAEGVYASSWSRKDDWGLSKERRMAKKEFRNQVKNLRRVRDYDLDHSLIYL